MPRKPWFALAWLVWCGIPHPALAQADPKAGATPPPLVSTPEQTPARPPQNDGKRVRVVLQDGQTLRGRLVSETADEIVLQLVSGGELRLARAQVKSLEDEP